MRIQQTNLPKVEQFNTESTSSETNAERTAAAAQQQDTFGSAIANQEQAATFKQEKSEIDHFLNNLKAITDDLGDARDYSQEQSVELQKRLTEITKATSEKSNTSAKIDEVLTKIIGSLRG
jgi:hypothetical protein